MTCCCCNVYMFGAIIGLLWALSRRARVCIRITTFILIITAITVVLLPIWLIRGRTSKNARIPIDAVVFLTPILLGITVKINGKENLVEDEGTVTICNHQSLLDLVVICHINQMKKNNIIGVAKKKVMYMFPFGLIFWCIDTIFFSAGNSQQTRDEINRKSSIIKTKKSAVFFFAEGTRSISDEILPFKKGAFYVALANQCKIQPFVASSMAFTKEKHFDNFELSILPPIPTKGLGEKDIDELIKKAHDCMQAEFVRLNSKKNA